MNFKEYAKYYDLLNADKDYSQEVSYIDSLIKKYNANAKNILELGCGTGKHAIELAKLGYKVDGIDLSDLMIQIGAENLAKHNNEYLNSVTLNQGDICSYSNGKKYDVVLSLFHVMSYQNTNEDLEKVLLNAQEHLNDEGIFIFDFWFGQGVLTDRPVVRVKKVEDDSLKIHRIATPIHFPDINVVDVNYEILITDTQSNITATIEEVHKMRYFFLPELKYFAQKNGFEFVNAYEYLSFDELNKTCWNGIIILKRTLK